MQDNFSTQSGLNTQLFSSVLLPFSDDLVLNGIAWNKKMSLWFTVPLNLTLLDHSLCLTNFTIPCLPTIQESRVNLQETLDSES
jgi:hypothetical protein